MAYLFQAMPADMLSAELPQFSPSLPEADKTRRLTSVFLSTLLAVPEFRACVLQLTGARHFGNRAEVYSRVRFRDEPDETGVPQLPADGFIRVKGAVTFSALLEARRQRFSAGNADDVQRIAQRLATARLRKIQRVIALAGTALDQSFLDAVRALPGAPPVDRLRSLTWMETIDAALHLLDRKIVRTPAGIFLLEQYVRSLKDEAVRDLQARAQRPEGAIYFNSLGADWAGLVRNLREGKTIDARDPRLPAAATNWLSFLRFLALYLTRGAMREEDILTFPNLRAASLLARKEIVTRRLRLDGKLLATFKKQDEVTETVLGVDLKDGQIFMRIGIDGPAGNSPALERIKALANTLRDDRTTGTTYIRIFWPGEKAGRAVTREQALTDLISIAPPQHDMVPERFIIERKVPLGPLAAEPESLVQFIMLELRGFRASVREILRRGLPGG
jgi:hypothetical protein